MPRPRYENLDPERKQSLLAAAMREFATHGYEGASINRILEAAGLSKGGFYYYFDDKADLAATAFIAAAEPVLFVDEQGLPESVEAFWAHLRAMSYRRLKLLESRRAEYECVIRLSSAMGRNPELAAQVLPRFEPGRKMMVGLLQRGVQLGALRDDLPLPMLMSLMEAAKRAAYESMFPGDRVPTEAEMESFTDLVIDLGQRVTAPKKG